MPLRVTFDTNTLADVVLPEASQQPTNPADAARVRAAIQLGKIQGFFSETLVTLEGVQTKDRAAVFGSTRLQSESTCTDENTITISIGVVQDRKPLEPRFFERIQAARGLGMRALRGPARIGWICVQDVDGMLFEPDGSTLELSARLDKVHKVATAIAERGLGHAAAVKFGLQFSASDGMSEPELWYKGLLRAKENGETNRVKEVVAEWADGDSVAAHYGYGIDRFCSQDFGQNAGKASVLHPDNRRWLREAFGIQFVTLAELAEMAAA
jgi:hypothetical protein